jgi:hypothetical protein
VILLANGTDVSAVITQSFAGLAILIGSIATLLANRNRSQGTELWTFKKQNRDLQDDILDLLQWDYKLRATLAQQGIDIPPLPLLRSQQTDPRYPKGDNR